MKYKRKIMFTLLLLFGFVTGILFSSLLNTINGPPLQDTDFVTACGELNTQTLTISNINALQGMCYIARGENNQSIGSEKCEKKDIARFIALNKKCGNAPIQKMFNNSIIYDNNSTPIDSYYRCVEDFSRGTKEGDLQINPLGSFTVTREGLDNTWACTISITNSKIYSVPHFIYD